MFLKFLKSFIVYHWPTLIIGKTWWDFFFKQLWFYPIVKCCVFDSIRLFNHCQCSSYTSNSNCPLIRQHHAFVLSKVEFNRCVWIDMAFIVSMDHNKPNIWIWITLTNLSFPGKFFTPLWPFRNWLTHWGRIYVSINLQALFPMIACQNQTIIWTNAGIKRFREILIEIYIFSFKKMHLNVICKMSATLSQPHYVEHSTVSIKNVFEYVVCICPPHLLMTQWVKQYLIMVTMATISSWWLSRVLRFEQTGGLILFSKNWVPNYISH